MKKKKEKMRVFRKLERRMNMNRGSNLEEKVLDDSISPFGLNCRYLSKSYLHPNPITTLAKLSNLCLHVT